MEEKSIAHGSSQNKTGNRGLIPGPVPCGKDPSQNQFSKSCDKIDGPIESKQVEPLKPKSLRGFHVLGELALDYRTVGAGLQQKQNVI